MAARIQRPGSAFSLDPSNKAQKRIRDDRHLTFIRSLPSVLSDRLGCEACHIRYGDPVYRKKHTGKAQKPDDLWCIPMTPDEHHDQHQNNEREWWNAKGIDPLAVARDLYAATGDREAALSILEKARAAARQPNRRI